MGNCSMDLNHMKRTVESEGQELLSDGNSQGNFLGNNEAGLIESKQKLILSTKSTDIMTTNDISDYSVHPSVLGPAYDIKDFKAYIVNPMGDKASGLCVIGLNDHGVRQAQILKRAKFLTTYHVKGEFGRATRTGWVDGKTAKCQGYKHLQKKSWLLEQMLVNISSSNQARAWNVAGVGLETEEAYEIACQGAVRPKELNETLVYNISLKQCKLPHFLMEVQCIEGPNDQDQTYLVRLIEEIAIKCRTVAHVSQISCAALGPWTKDQTLLHKQLTLQNVLNNISDNRKIYREFIAKPHGIFRTNVQTKQSRNTKAIEQ